MPALAVAITLCTMFRTRCLRQSVVLAGWLLLWPMALRAEAPFTRTLTPEQFRAAGLDQLSAEQLAALDALVAARATPAEPSAPGARRLESPDSQSVPLEARVGRKEARVEQRRISSRLEGTFSGWRSGTIFRLANGQRWVSVDNSSYEAVPPRESPAVEVIPALMGTYFLRIDGVGVRCRVKLLDE